MQKGGNPKISEIKSKLIAEYDAILQIKKDAISKIKSEGISSKQKVKEEARESARLAGETAEKILEAGEKAEKAEKDRLDNLVIDLLKEAYNVTLKFKEQHDLQIKSEIKKLKEEEGEVENELIRVQTEAGKTKKEIAQLITGLSEMEIAVLAIGASKKIEDELDKGISIEELIDDGKTLKEILEEAIDKQVIELRGYYNKILKDLSEELNEMYSEKFSGKDFVITVPNTGSDTREFIYNNCMWISLCCFLRTLPQYRNINIDDIKEIGELYHTWYDKNEFDTDNINFREAILKIVRHFNLEIRVYEVCNKRTDPLYNKIVKTHKIKNKFALEPYQPLTGIIEPPNYAHYHHNYDPILNQTNNELELPADRHIVNIAHYSSPQHFELITKGYFFEDITAKIDAIGREKIIKYDMES